MTVNVHVFISKPLTDPVLVVVYIWDVLELLKFFLELLLFFLFSLELLGDLGQSERAVFFYLFGQPFQELVKSVLGLDLLLEDQLGEDGAVAQQAIDDRVYVEEQVALDFEEVSWELTWCMKSGQCQW